MSDTKPWLVADIGGTNARFARARIVDGRPVLEGLETAPVKDHPSLLEAVADYLDRCPERPASGVLAVAGPVTDGAVSFINSPWEVSEAELTGIGLKPVRLLNDFQALAWALPHLGSEDRVQVGGPGEGLAGATLAVLGPGTGFGVSALVRSGPDQQATLATEGGHASFAPTDAVEEQIADILRRRFGRVSIERLISGPGLVNLHQALAEIEGQTTDIDDPAEITRQARADPNGLAATSLNRFCAILGSVAGDIALTIGARGGLHIGGGIAPRIIDLLHASPFRQRFEAKGRYTAYMQAIPTWVILDPHATLRGAATVARQRR